MKTRKNPEGYLYKVDFNVISSFGDCVDTFINLEPYTIVTISKWVQKKTWWFGRLKWQWNHMFCFSVDKIIDKKTCFFATRADMYKEFDKHSLPLSIWKSILNKTSYINIGKIVD